MTRTGRTRRSGASGALRTAARSPRGIDVDGRIGHRGALQRPLPVQVVEQVSLVRLIPADTVGGDRAEIQAVDVGADQQGAILDFATSGFES